ncbi:unnamed protein product [Caenorhabditis nigoni]
MSCRAVSVLSKCRISQQQIRGKAHFTFQPSQTLPAAHQLVNRKMTARTTSSPFGSHQIRNYATTYYPDGVEVPRPQGLDILISDIKENDLEKVGADAGIPNLSTGTFPKNPFPATGIIYGDGSRPMIPLLVRHHKNKSSEAHYVWFLVRTASPHTYLSAKSMEVLIGKGFTEGRHSFAIQDESMEFGCYPSREPFSELNVLGVDYITAMKLSIIFDWKNKTFQLIQI